MKNIWNMMRELKQVDVHKYLWLALFLFLFNTAWCFLEYRVLRNPMYPNVYYHLPELFSIAFRIALIAFFIFQLKDAFGFMNKGNLERILLLPAHRFLYPIMQITFSFLCILLLWCSMSASLLVSYALHVVSFGGLRDGLIYALLENEFLSMLLPLPWDQLLPYGSAFSVRTLLLAYSLASGICVLSTFLAFDEKTTKRGWCSLAGTLILSILLLYFVQEIIAMLVLFMICSGWLKQACKCWNYEEGRQKSC